MVTGLAEPSADCELPSACTRDASVGAGEQQDSRSYEQQKPRRKMPRVKEHREPPSVGQQETERYQVARKSDILHWHERAHNSPIKRLSIAILLARVNLKNKNPRRVARVLC